MQEQIIELLRWRRLERSMKESQARTKVVLRHLPPSITQAALLEHVDSKFAGCYSWFSFRPGKSSVKRQVLSRAYINFKKAEDVYDFCEDFDGHVFVNEKGTQYKVIVEYAPYQRIPKPRSKKDIREGTISKDSDYLEFLEMLGKPTEYLPSAEVQLERREAEKAAALAGSGGGKEAVVVTPLMEFVRQRRAAKSGTQRSIASKLGARSGGVTVITSSMTSHKRGLERSRSGPLMYVSENATSSLSIQKDSKEVTVREPTTGQRREEQHQRKDREVVIEKRKREITEGKEKKVVHEPVSIVSSTKGNTAANPVEAWKEETGLAKDSLDLTAVNDSKADGADALEELSSSLMTPVTGKAANAGSSEGGVGDVSKDFGKREVIKRKQSMQIKEKQHKDLEIGLSSPGQVSVGNHNSYNQRHRPPVSPRVVPTSAQSQLATSSHAAASGEVSTGATLSKPNHRRELLGKNSKGTISPRDQQSPSHTLSNVVLLEQSRSQQGSPQSDRAGKRPPRPQSVRVIGKEPTSGEAEGGSLSSNSSTTPVLAEERIISAPATESFSGPDRQDSRRVRNKDRPDRPVWTPRRRSDASQSPELSAIPTVASTTSTVSHLTDSSNVIVKVEKAERGQKRSVGKSGQLPGQNWVESCSLGLPNEGGRSSSGAGSIGPNNAVSGKARYVETSNTRSTRGARAVSTQEQNAHQGEQKIDNPLPATVDMKTSQTALNNLRENGEHHTSAGTDKEKPKQDNAPVWNELTGGSHRRRERNVQHGSRDSDGSASVPETSKPIKRGGNLAMGGNEKQVWVAVQKAGSGT